MKITLQTKLLPTCGQVLLLEATLRAFNAACDWLAGEAFTRRMSNKITLQKVFNATLRERFALSAQMAVRCIAQVCEAYRRDKTKCPHFDEFAAMPCDQRLLSFRGEACVSLLTLSGRIPVPLVMRAFQRERFALPKGQSDLIRRRDGTGFLHVTVDVPEETPGQMTGTLGVDLGIAKLATDSDGHAFSGEKTDRVRERTARLKSALQKAGTKSAKRHLKKLSGREARFKRDTNHVLSKQLVRKAKDTGRSLALEDPGGSETGKRGLRPSGTGSENGPSTSFAGS